MLDLPGNETLAERIRQAAARRALSHALLFTGSGDRLAAARFTAAAMECTSETGRPCGTCNACRKTLHDIHPDVITVRDDEHKNLSAEVVRAARADAWIQPNEGLRKIYIFPDCSLLTESDQNILLKTVEEGPPYAAFLFCAENVSAALPTLRSRCVELKLHPVENAPGTGGVQALAAQLCRTLSKGHRGETASLLLPLDAKKLSRDELQTLLLESREMAAAALLQQYGYAQPDMQSEPVQLLANRLSRQKLMRIVEVLQKYQRQVASANLNVGLTTGALAVELEELC